MLIPQLISDNTMNITLLHSVLYHLSSSQKAVGHSKSSFCLKYIWVGYSLKQVVYILQYAFQEDDNEATISLDYKILPKGSYFGKQSNKVSAYIQGNIFSIIIPIVSRKSIPHHLFRLTGTDIEQNVPIKY